MAYIVYAGDNSIRDPARSNVSAGLIAAITVIIYL